MTKPTDPSIDDLELSVEDSRRGAHTEAPNGQGWSPLGWASDRGHVEVVLVLPQKGADLKARQADDLTPLHVAQGDEVTLLFLKYGADNNARNFKGQTSDPRCIMRHFSDMWELSSPSREWHRCERERRQRESVLSGIRSLVRA